MNDDSHTAHEPHPTAAMDRQHRGEELKDLLYRPSEDTVFMSDFNENEVVHIELVGKRRVYSEAAYNKLLAERDRLRKAIEKHRRDIWGNGPVGHLYDKNLYAALQEDRDD